MSYAITKIEEYTSSIKYESFMDNHLIQDGIIRQIEIEEEEKKWAGFGTLTILWTTKC
jgi:uncharacterized protein with HEPN domain